VPVTVESRAGRSGGGLCYGYDVVPGEERGGRTINENEAAIDAALGNGREQRVVAWPDRRGAADRTVLNRGVPAEVGRIPGVDGGAGIFAASARTPTRPMSAWRRPVTVYRRTSLQAIRIKRHGAIASIDAKRLEWRNPGSLPRWVKPKRDPDERRESGSQQKRLHRE
jgi:hypothetical protein